MLWLVFVILIAVWVLCLATAVTLGGFIHLLLVNAFAILLVQFINKRRLV